MSSQLKLSRQQLAAFLKDHESIKQFENLFRVAQTVAPDGDNETIIVAANAESRAQQAVDLVLSLVEEVAHNTAFYDAKANQAIDAISRLSSALELLAMAPQQTLSAIEDVLPAGQSSAATDDVSPPQRPVELIDSDAAINGNLTLPKTSGVGIRIDKVAPTFGWRDLLGEPHIHTAGANDPTFNVFRNTLRQYQYSNVLMNETWYEYHIPHDYVPGTDVYCHVHWSQIVVDTGGTAGVPGVVKWFADISYAKGHGTPGGAADAFGAIVTTSMTQQGSTTQYGHMLAEMIITDNGAALINRTRLEPDGVILLRLYRDPADAADTLNQGPFIHYVDIHYQSTNLATKQKAPNFYV